MKTSIKLFALGIVLMGFGVNANAQLGPAVTGASNATVILPLTIEEKIELDFGRFAPTGVPSTVVLATDGTRAASEATITGLGGGVAGSFEVVGGLSESFSIVISAGSTLTSVAVGAVAMTTTGWNSNPVATGTTGAQDGKATILVGATLLVAAAQTPGTYSGTYIVTVAYN